MNIAKIIGSGVCVISYLLKDNDKLILNDFECVNCKVRLYPKSYKNNNIRPYFSLSKGSKHLKNDCNSVSVMAYKQNIGTNKFAISITKPATPSKLLLASFKSEENKVENLDTKLTLPTSTKIAQSCKNRNSTQRGDYISHSFKKICLSYINDYKEVRTKKLEIVGIGTHSYANFFKYVFKNNLVQPLVFFGLIKLDPTLKNLSMVNIMSTKLEVFLLHGKTEVKLQITLEQSFSIQFIKNLETKIEKERKKKKKNVLLFFIGEMIDEQLYVVNSVSHLYYKNNLTIKKGKII